jgi:hypothetical protein
MARGDNPNSRANLIKNSDRTPKERQEQARKAGKASGEARAVYKSLNADLREQCDEETLRAINDRLLQMAKHGNLRAYELVRDGLGEKPTEKHEVTINDDSMREMDEFFKRADNEPAEE